MCLDPGASGESVVHTLAKDWLSPASLKPCLVEGHEETSLSSCGGVPADESILTSNAGCRTLSDAETGSKPWISRSTSNNTREGKRHAQVVYLAKYLRGGTTRANNDKKQRSTVSHRHTAATQPLPSVIINKLAYDSSHSTSSATTFLQRSFGCASGSCQAPSQRAIADGSPISVPPVDCHGSLGTFPGRCLDRLANHDRNVVDNTGVRRASSCKRHCFQFCIYEQMSGLIMSLRHQLTHDGFCTC